MNKHKSLISCSMAMLLMTQGARAADLDYPPPQGEVVQVQPQAPVCQPALTYGLAPNEALAIRLGPGVEFPQVAIIAPGYPVDVCGRVENWGRVKTCMVNVPQCAEGWASLSYLVPVVRRD